MATPKAQLPAKALPALLPIQEIQARLGLIFPDSFPDRSILVGTMAARVVFVFLYGGFIEEQARYLRPSYVYLFTEDQAQKISEKERAEWLAVCSRPGFRPSGDRWYADNSRESIRDDLMRNQLLRLGIMQRLPNVPTTSSKPAAYLSADFAALFAPSLTGEAIAAVADAWRATHLNAATQQRMALKAQGLQAKAGDLLINLPDGARIRITGGPSSEIAKGLIEDFARHHLKNPALLWLSASDKKAYPQFVETSKTVGLSFDVGTTLPDLILADLNEPVRFIFCEVVATDGAVTDVRRQELLGIVRASQVPETAVEFLSAFEDRESAAFKKRFSQLAVNSLVWFRTEPHLLVVMSTVSQEIS